MTDGVDPESCLHESLHALREASSAFGAAGAVVTDGATVAVGAVGMADQRARVSMTPQTTFELASQTKLMTTFAVLTLARDGRIDLDARVTDFVPESCFSVPQEARKVTLDHLMRHTAGFGHLTRPRSLSRPLHSSGLSMWRRKSSSASVSSDGPLEMRTPAGAQARYSNVGSALLAEVLERRLGIPYAEALEDLVFEPLGMSATTIGLNEVPSAARYKFSRVSTPWDLYPRWKGIAGGLSTIEDLARLVSPYTRLVDQVDLNGVLLRSITPHFSPSGDGLPGHVAGWRREVVGGTVVLHQAGTHPGMTVKAVALPEHATAVVLLANCSARPQIHAAAQGLAQRLASIPDQRLPARTPRSMEVAGRYVLAGGPVDYPTYWADCGRTLVISLEASGAQVSGGRVRPTPLVELGDGTLGFEHAGALVTIRPSVTASNRSLVLGGPYTGVTLRRVS